MMSDESVYLDNAAGTPIGRPAIEAGLEAADLYANPAALHASARQAAGFLEICRTEIAQILAVKPSGLVFTAGATEANNLLNLSLRQTYPGAKIACLNIDHDSWRANADNLLAVKPETGQIEATAILGLDDNVCCLSLAGVNSEVGVVQSFSALKKALAEHRKTRRQRGVRLPLLLHIDASQMALTHNLQPQALADADMVTLNGAKFYAFKQSGLIYIRPGLGLRPPFGGGGQEAGFRPGSQSLVLAAGLRAALGDVSSRRHHQHRRLEALRDEFEDRLAALGAAIVLKKSDRSPHITSAVFEGRDNEMLALKLSQAGIYVGTGSACHSLRQETDGSVLSALGYKPPAIRGALRFSLAYETERDHLMRALSALKTILETAR